MVDFGTYRSVVTQEDIDFATPDSVDYQYPVSTFGTSEWTDDVGGANMSVNGMTADTFSNGENSVLGQTDDYGTASNPATYGSLSSWGIAFTVEFASTSDTNAYMSCYDGTNRFAIRDNNGGDIRLFCDSADFQEERLNVATDNTFATGTPHLVVINKGSDDANDIDIYVDDMTNGNEQSVTISDNAFVSGNYSAPSNLGFYSRYRETTANDLFADIKCGVFEFNSQPYTEQERENLKSRRPEV